MLEPRTPSHLIDDDSAPFIDLDHRRLARVKRSLDYALELQKWWEKKNEKWACEFDGRQLAAIVRSDTYAQCFHLSQGLPASGDAEAHHGFFDEASIGGEIRPVMGLFQQTLFDAPRAYFVDRGDKPAVLEHWRQDLREFVLGYLIRVTGYSQPAPYVNPDLRPFESWLQPFSWYPADADRRGGFGFSRLYYKRREQERYGKFHDVDQPSIDLRQLGTEFDWVVVSVRIHDLHLQNPVVDWLNLSIKEDVLAVISRDFGCDDTTVRGSVRGRYGFGYAFIDDQREGGAIQWQRPAFGFQRNHFLVLDDGRILARIVLVSDKFPKLMTFDPIAWSRSVADRASLGLFGPAWQVVAALFAAWTPTALRSALATAPDSLPRVDPLGMYISAVDTAPLGLAATLGISYDNLLRSLLADFVRSQVGTITAARGVWRAVSDWTDKSAVPAWVP